MYIQITTRCNFRCGHCCFGCRRTGTDMALDTFMAALELDDYVTLGGGEPTIHPQFEQFLGAAIVHSSDEASPMVITNGSQTDVSLRLASLARRGIISAELSRSRWHLEQQSIDDRVVRAFTVQPQSYTYTYDYRSPRDARDARGIRVTTIPVKAGRQKTGTDYCACEDTLVDPEGRIWRCGCKLEQFGTVFATKFPPDYDPGCSKTVKTHAGMAEQ